MWAAQPTPEDPGWPSCQDQGPWPRLGRGLGAEGGVRTAQGPEGPRDLARRRCAGQGRAGSSPAPGCGLGQGLTLEAEAKTDHPVTGRGKALTARSPLLLREGPGASSKLGVPCAGFPGSGTQVRAQGQLSGALFWKSHRLLMKEQGALVFLRGKHSGALLGNKSTSSRAPDRPGLGAPPCSAAPGGRGQLLPGRPRPPPGRTSARGPEGESGGEQWAQGPES